MILKRKDFLDAVKFLKPAIGENESRKNLTVLNVEQSTKDMVNLTGADSYIIKRVRIEMAVRSTFYSFEIPKQVLCIFEKICKLDKSIETVELSGSVLKCGGLGLKYTPQDTEYPNLEKLLATEYKKPPKDFYVGLNAFMVEQAMIGFSKTQKEVVKFWFKDKEAPVKITSQDGNYTAMIMPVRIKW